MRIENSANRNNSNAFQQKNQSKKESKEVETLNNSGDYLDLSAGILLLNQLLASEKHQYTPLPFYFANAVSRNMQQARKIANSIQQDALELEAELNFNMILELVLSRENEKSLENNSAESKIINQATYYQHNPLQNGESIFFEIFYNKSIQQNISPQVISSIVVEYSIYIEENNIVATTQEEQIVILMNRIVNSNHSGVASNLIQLRKILRSFIDY